MNLAYYYKHGVHLFTVDALPAWLISIALPVAIARYSHLIAKHGGQDVAVQFDWRAWVQRARAWVQRDGVQPATPANEDATLQALVAGGVIPGLETMMQMQQDIAVGEPDVDKKYLARMMEQEGLNKAQIADQLGVHPTTVGRWLKK
jgi:transposase-like protein